MASDGRSFSVGYYSWDIDGVKCGILNEFSGGDTSGEVATLPMAHDYYVKKQISLVKYEDYSLKMGLSMGKPVQDWIQSSLEMNYQRKSGQINKADFKREVRSVLEFKDALLSEIGFPGCDGGSKEPAYLSLKFTPWISRYKKGDGAKVENDVNWAQKVWLPSNFRFSVDGLEQNCKKTQKVDALTVKQTNVRDNIGEERDYLHEPCKIEFPNIKVTMSAEYSDLFYTWFEDFVINGNCDESKHKTGTLVFLDQPRQKELLTLNFQGLGIFKIASNAQKNNADELATVTADLYCENITVAFGA